MEKMIKNVIDLSACGGGTASINLSIRFIFDVESTKRCLILALLTICGSL